MPRRLPPAVWILASQSLKWHLVLQEGYDVLGGYLSPVNDAYGKAGLLVARHRLHMCELAAQESAMVMVDSWEASQPQYQRSLAVLRRVSTCLEASYSRIVH